MFATATGASVIARTLQSLGVDTIFSIVGIRVVEIAEDALNRGIRFAGFRNEQTASYAAGASGYLTGRLGVCLVIGGPGMLNTAVRALALGPISALARQRTQGRHAQRLLFPAAGAAGGASSKRRKALSALL
jgi:hypothetical protein